MGLGLCSACVSPVDVHGSASGHNQSTPSESNSRVEGGAEKSGLPGGIYGLRSATIDVYFSTIDAFDPFRMDVDLSALDLTLYRGGGQISSFIDGDGESAIACFLEEVSGEPQILDLRECESDPNGSVVVIRLVRMESVQLILCPMYDSPVNDPDGMAQWRSGMRRATFTFTREMVRLIDIEHRSQWRLPPSLVKP